MSRSEYRTTVPDVRAEIEADGYEIGLISDPQIETVGLTPAHLEVEERLAGTGMSENRLELLERYLAGHFVLASGVEELRQADQVSESDGASRSYAQPDSRDGGYDETSLGRKAIAIDESGRLANVNKSGPVVKTPDARGPTTTDRGP